MSRVYARHTTEHLVTGDSPINTTGEPLGGGPGYGQIVDPDQWEGRVHRPRTLYALLLLMESFVKDGGQYLMPEPTQPDDLIWVPHDLAFDLTGLHSIAIPDGVTLASDRGRAGAPGIYSQGALLYSTRYWWKERGVCQTGLFQCAGSGRMTGLRIYGPGPDDCIANANETAWSGGSLGFKFPKERTLHALTEATGHSAFEVDNCEVAYFNDWLVWCELVADLDSIHHCYLHDAMRQGYGYGIWPGEPEWERAELSVFGNLYRNCRHFTDSRKNADGAERPVFFVRDSALVGISRNKPLNTHTERGPNGTPLSGFVRRYERLLVDVQGERVGASDPLLYNGAPVPEGGSLVFDTIYARRPDGQVQTHDGAILLDEFDATSPAYDTEYRFVDKVGTIRVSNIRPATDLERAALTLSLSSANPTAGAEIALRIESSYPCAHYEILWGDGYGVDDPAQLTRTTRTALTHTYRESGLYTIWVCGYDGLGVPSLEATARVRVEPTHAEPELVFWARADWPTAAMKQEDLWAYEDLFRLDVMGHFTEASDLLGWTRIAVTIDGVLLRPMPDEILPVFEAKCTRTPEPGEPQSCAFFIDDLALFNVDGHFEDGFDYSEQELRDRYGVDGRFRIYRFTRYRGGGCLMIPSPKPIAGDVVRFEPAHAFRLTPKEVPA